MTWLDNLRPAAYRGPSGLRQVFSYENVSTEFTKRTSAFNFPDTDGTFIQDLGRTGRRMPMRVIFSGPDYDVEAATFESLMIEKGVGVLEHPMYGVLNVVPFGTVARRDDLKTAANQAIFTVTFWETIEAVFPTPQESPTDAVIESVDDFNGDAAGAYEALMDLETVPKQSTALIRIKQLVQNTKNGLQAVADTVASVQKQFDAVFDSINGSIDILISTPLTLATQITALIQSPARASALISDRLDAYKNLADLTIKNLGNSFNVYLPDQNSTNANNFQTDDLNASSYMTGSVLSVVNNTFATATDALDAAEFMLVQYDELVEWRDLNYESLGEIDTGETYQSLQDAVFTAVNFLVQISFTLKQERTLVLTYPRTVIDLVFELYGELDEQLDFFINSNNLTGSEILEIPAGRTIVYYV